MTNKWKSICVAPGAPIRDVLKKIDESTLQIALVVDEYGRLLGTVTDGDVRRSILRGVGLQEKICEIMNSHPKTANFNENRESTLASMRSRQIFQLPIVDAEGLVVGLESLADLLQVPLRDNPVVLMAGGFGKRLTPLTDECPKPLIKVGGRPIIETILLNFIESGFHRFYVSVNHKAEMIMDYLGDGSAWNVQIEYLRESFPRGTAGAISMIPERPQSTFIVMNGDILTKVHLGRLLDYHQQKRAAATMCIREYEYQVPFGVVELSDQTILNIAEKPIHKYFVNAGIYALEPEVIDHIPTDSYFDITSLFAKIIEDKATTAAFPLLEYWLDIGRHTDLSTAQRDFESYFR